MPHTMPSPLEVDCYLAVDRSEIDRRAAIEHATELGASLTGHHALEALQRFIFSHYLSLDALNKRAVHALLELSISSAGTTLDVMREALETSARNLIPPEPVERTR